MSDDDIMQFIQVTTYMHYTQTDKQLYVIYVIQLFTDPQTTYIHIPLFTLSLPKISCTKFSVKTVT